MIIEAPRAESSEESSQPPGPPQLQLEDKESKYKMQERYRNADLEIKQSSSSSSFSTCSAKGVFVAVLMMMIVMTALTIARYESNELPLHAVFLQRPASPSGWKGSETMERRPERRLRSSQCQQRCGAMEIPYPFGLSPDCSLSKFFQLDCIFKEGINVSSASSELGYWPFLTDVVTGSAAGWQYNNTSQRPFPYEYNARSFQVLNFNAEYIVIETTAIADYNVSAEGKASIVLRQDGPYRITGGNVLTAVGCNSKASYKAFPNPTGGVTARCGPNSCSNQFLFDYCNYYDCCAAPIEFALSIRIKGEGTAFADSSTCGYGTILQPESYATARPGTFASGVYGTELLWYVPFNISAPQVELMYRNSSLSVCDFVNKSSQDYACAAGDQNVCSGIYVHSAALDAGNLTGAGYGCLCAGGYQGDGYKYGTPCADVDECLDETQNNCDGMHGAQCINLPGSYNCSCPRGADGDGFKNGTGCIGTGGGGPNVPLIAGLTSVPGALVIVTICGLFLWSWFYRRRYQDADQMLSRMEVLREMQMEGGANICRIFPLKELQKATCNFEESTVIGVGGCGKIYRGTLDDGTEVAIKRAKIDIAGGRDETKQFINEIKILSTLNHHNLVKLLGCCLESQIPILVYEFVAKGSLYDYIQRGRWTPTSNSEDSQTSRQQPPEDEYLCQSLGWDQRLQISIDTANALSYLHSGTSPPIYHRDVKSANILLDEKYVAKVVDFGISKLLPVGDERSRFSTVVQGTIGYLDPEYFENFQVTQKTDVYSYGVVLLELLTAAKAVDYSQPRRDQNLALRLLWSNHNT